MTNMKNLRTIGLFLLACVFAVSCGYSGVENNKEISKVEETISKDDKFID